ncbi:MAG: alpha-glucuronidase family glycosyl hydrolase [Paludibacter sp.]
MQLKVKYTLFFLIYFIGFEQSHAEDGNRLWLRFSEIRINKTLFSGIYSNDNSLAITEFQKAWNEMAGENLPLQSEIKSNSLLFLKGKSAVIKQLKIQDKLKKAGQEGFVIRSETINDKPVTIVAANTHAGLLYGAFHLLRLLQTGDYNISLNILEVPSYNVRILNHWDNPDGSVERGYAGRSIWKWDELPAKISPRYIEYARANASIGINATVLNNVNASPKMLTPEYLQKVKAIAHVLRPFNIKVFLSINFSSPKAIGGLPTADPLDKNVQIWWRNKAKEIYKLIPDFGGFLVKANSEGLPGPMDYGRTHVDGANMLADALKPFGGIVMWRAFVYEPGDDRVKLAYNEFHKFDGQFRDNVIIQVKNGPVDFQPREPFSPLFGAMKKTPLMPELQITQEYLGQGNHLVFLAPMWEEFLKSDTYAEGKGTSIDKLTTGKIYPQKFTAFAGVSNIGEDTNWCGHHFAQANWYAFGRLAWNNQLSSAQIADEWVKMTFGQRTTQKTDSNQLSVVSSLSSIMLSSYETCVNYMMPLGLHHLFAWNHHYGPEPWGDVLGARPDWLPKYYHRADSIGLGANRTTSGSNAVSQYHSPLCEQLNDIHRCPEKYLLWFHHVSWDFKMQSGKTLWEELCYKYSLGVQEAREYKNTWNKVEKQIDPQRFAQVKLKLATQEHDAAWWKDACLLYFQTFSKRPFPHPVELPTATLDSLKSIHLEFESSQLKAMNFN